MLQNLFSIRQFRLTKWSFLVHSTTRKAPYILLSHEWFLDLWGTLGNDYKDAMFLFQIFQHVQGPTE